MTVSLIVALVAFSVSQDPYSEVVQTVNLDPDWVDPTPREFADQTSRYEPFRARHLLGSREVPDMVILLQEGLASQIGVDLLQQWIDDIEAEEYVAQVVEITYGTPEEIKGFLGALHSQGLQGAVLVGNLPAAWTAVWDTEVGAGEHCPTDYYLMDLDGEWLDLWVGYPRDSLPGQDGFYDTFQGSLDPEIWVGRIRVDNLSALGDPVAMLQAYLQRNHEWRLNGDPEPVRALCYVDDDWQWSGDVYKAAMELLYENVELFNRSVETCERDYESIRLPDAYVWVSPFVHSNPTSHQWLPAGGLTYWNEIVPIGPEAHFYNLFACSNCRFTTNNYMGGVYSFATDEGLAAVGSTTSGAMLFFTCFYAPLGEGASLGEAYMQWWDHISEYGLTQAELNWHIGMVLLGDPSLVPVMHLTGVGEEGPEAFVLAVAPNPSAGAATAMFDLAAPANVSMAVFDISGRLVQFTEPAEYQPGAHSMQIEEPGPGVYLVHLRAGDSEATERFVVVGR